MANIPFKSITFPGLPNKYTVPEISSDLMTAGKAADAKATGDALSALEDAVGEETDKLKADLGAQVANVNGAKQITSFAKGYIITNQPTIDVNSVVSHAELRHAVVECSAGDIFTLTGEGGSTGRLWCFVDSEGNYLTRAANNTVADSLIITAPTNSAYLVINTKGGSCCFYGNTVSYKVDKRVKNIVPLSNRTLSKYISPIDGSINTASLMDYVEFAVIYGDTIFYKTSKDETVAGIAFYDSTGAFLYGRLATLAGESISVPQNAVIARASYRKDAFDKLEVTYMDSVKTLIDAINSMDNARLTDNGLQKEIIFKRGVIYNRGENIADSVANPHSTNSWEYAIIPCVEGDMFTIFADSSGTVDAYCLTDNEYNVIYYNRTTHLLNSVITIPAGVSYIVINKYASRTNKSYYGASDTAVNKNNINNLANYTPGYLSLSPENMSYTWWTSPLFEHVNRIRNKLYWGYTTHDGYIGIAEKEITGSYIKKLHLFKTPSGDDHNALAVHLLSDGTLICAHSGGHNRDYKLYVYRSNSPESIDGFKAVTLTSGGYKSYAQIHEYNGKLYLFYRISDNAWAYRISTDFGLTWGAEIILITSDVKYYCLFKETTTAGVLRVCMYSNPGSGDPDIRQAFFRLESGELYNSDNVTLLGTSNVDKDDVDVLIATATGFTTQRLLDVAITAIDSPLILYCVFPNATNAEYRIFDNGSIVTVATTTNLLLTYTPLGASWIGTNKLVLGRADTTNDIIEIYDYTSGSVSLHSTVTTEARGNLPIRNNRPIVSNDGNYILYQRGYYSGDYRNFDTDIVITSA